MAEKKITYQQAVTEIEDILQKIEQEDLDVDELTEKVKRVSYLLKLCKKKLHTTESEVEKVLEEMNEEREQNDNDKEATE